ncbi:hypothetical protein BH20CHL7_BH20CHL7_09230 [soil metagenome]
MITRAARIRVVIVLMAILVVVARYPASRHDRREVLVAGERWTVLLAEADGMRGMVGFDGADGMLFDMDRDTDPGAVGFVMDGVAMALDIAWFTDAGGLVGTASMGPCAAAPCPVTRAPAPFRWAIEAPAGRFRAFPPDARLEVSP